MSKTFLYGMAIGMALMVSIVIALGIGYAASMAFTALLFAGISAAFDALTRNREQAHRER